MEIILAKTAGFCAGVRRAVDMAYKYAAEGNICALGAVIHNKTVTGELEALGVEIIEDPSEARGRKTLTRAHGIPPETRRELEALGVSHIDATCRDVRKICDLVEKSVADGREIILLGKKDHPEIIAENGITGYKARVISKAEDIAPEGFDKDKKYALMAQTTFSAEEFEKISSAIKSTGLDVIIYPTICGATSARQKEAAEIAAKTDKMIVLGDRKSANSLELYELCKKINNNVYFIESIKELQLNIFGKSDKIGITAGASTPPATIKEALQLMSDLEKRNDESFEEMLSENIVSLRTGDTVKGAVIQVINGEVSVNLGYKSDGVIPRSEFSEDPDLEPSEHVKPGDVIDVFVVHVNDADGNVLLSKKRIDYLKNVDEAEKAVESKAVLKGKIIETVKGGAIAVINGLRAFVPSSQISNRYVEDIEAFKGKELEFNILEFDKSKRKIIAGRKELAAKLIEENKARAFDSLEVGQLVEGKVSRLVDFGAFIDLNGVDGLVHVSEISWNRIRKPSDALKIGQEVRAYIVGLNKEKGKISLSIKNVAGDPWAAAEEKYAVGNVISGTVVRMAPFGAFVALEDGIDGLLHISQISENRIQNPEEVLSIGDVVTVKVTDLNLETKRISLSKKQYDRQLAREARNAESLEDEAPTPEGPYEGEPYADENPEPESCETGTPEENLCAGCCAEAEAPAPADEFFEKDSEN